MTVDYGNPDFLMYVLLWAVGGGVVAGFIWQSKGGSFGGGFLMGALLGIFGVIIAALAKPSPRVNTAGPPGQALRECPYCKTAIRRDASVCPHCQRESEAWTFHKGKWWVRRKDGWYWLNDQTGEWALVTNEEAEAQRQAATETPRSSGE